MTDAERAKALPASLADVADTLGLEVALKIISEFGGQEIKFPKLPDDDHPVIVALGKEDGYAVCQFLTGCFIYVPHMKARRSVRMDVLALQSAGKGRREIARILGVSQRHVRRMANKAKNPNQYDLFG